jgi:spermidine synthase
LTTTKKKYDLVILDAFTGYFTIPEHLLTREFFMQIKDVLKPEGVLAVNFVLNPNFSDAFSIRVDNTFRSVFPHYNRQVVQEGYNGMEDSPDYKANVAYIYYNHAGTDASTVYTDDRTSAYKDKERAVKK